MADPGFTTSYPCREHEYPLPPPVSINSASRFPWIKITSNHEWLSLRKWTCSAHCIVMICLFVLQLLDLFMVWDWSTYLADYGQPTSKYLRVNPSTALALLEKSVFLLCSLYFITRAYSFVGFIHWHISKKLQFACWCDWCRSRQRLIEFSFSLNANVRQSQPRVGNNHFTPFPPAINVFISNPLLYTAQPDLIDPKVLINFLQQHNPEFEFQLQGESQVY